MSRYYVRYHSYVAHAFLEIRTVFYAPSQNRFLCLFYINYDLGMLALFSSATLEAYASRHNGGTIECPLEHALLKYCCDVRGVSGDPELGV